MHKLLNMKIVKLNISDLEGNIGQIPGLPKNSRKWSEDEISVLAASLLETPELFEARPIICVPYGEKYVILGGNMRFEASKKNQAKTVPCVVMPSDTPIEKMIEIVAKDNGSFGHWDIPELQKSWSQHNLSDWGVVKLPSIDISGLFSDIEPKHKEKTTQEITIVLDCDVDIEQVKKTIVEALGDINFKMK